MTLREKKKLNGTLIYIHRLGNRKTPVAAVQQSLPFSNTGQIKAYSGKKNIKKKERILIYTLKKKNNPHFLQKYIVS